MLLVDRDRHGADTLSTLALMRVGVLALHRWGLLDRVRAAGTPAITSTSFIYGDETMTIPIKSRNGVDALYAPRRTVIDALLAEAATGSGAEVDSRSAPGRPRACPGRSGGRRGDRGAPAAPCAGWEPTS